MNYTPNLNPYLNGLYQNPMNNINQQQNANISQFKGYYINNYNDVVNTPVNADGSAVLFVNIDQNMMWVKKINGGTPVIQPYSLSAVYQNQEPLPVPIVNNAQPVATENKKPEEKLYAFLESMESKLNGLDTKLTNVVNDVENLKGDKRYDGKNVNEQPIKSVEIKQPTSISNDK